ncbi:MAG: nucleotidyl transferase AbiEii/AbiGii toxin family protein [Candidatus Woesearchaeota archaeon]
MEIEELRRLAAKEELSLNYIAKDLMISKALFQLQNVENIVLKGGTAINRAYLRNRRFSEDIDFDLIFKGTVKQALSKTKEITAIITGFEVAKPRIMKTTIRYDLFYINPLNHKDKIRLEFRVVDKASKYTQKIVNFGFAPTDSALLNVYEIEEMIKHKIDCILNRLEGKDWYDLYYLLKLNHKPIKIPKKEIIEKITLQNEQIKMAANIVNHYIPKNKRPNWEIFLKELKEKIEKE